MKSIISFLVLIFSSLAFAKPADIICSGSNSGQAVELKIGIDSYDQIVPSIIEITLANQIVFESSVILESMVNVGTNADPSMNLIWTANDEESNLIVKFPEQDFGDDLKINITLETDVVVNKISELELLCN